MTRRARQLNVRLVVQAAAAELTNGKAAVATAAKDAAAAVKVSPSPKKSGKKSKGGKKSKDTVIGAVP